MSSYVYELPTTGNLVFSEVLNDRSGKYTHAIANATVARSNLRAALKESKRTDDGEKDYLRIVKVIVDYLPHIYAIIDCVRSGDLELRQLPIFSWRSTLSSNLLNNSPRQNVPGLLADLSFTLITYAFTKVNLAASFLTSLGSYERDPTISNEQRLVKDKKLNFTVQLLTESAGIFAHVAQVVLPEWERTLDETGSSGISRPVDLSKELILGLSKFSLAEAQTLTVRKLMSRSAYDSTLTPGPPLPKSHPKPGLIAKISLSALENYTSALSLCKSAKGGVGGSGGVAGLQKSTEVTKDLTRWIKDETDLISALSHKWLGVEAGEQPSPSSGSGSSSAGGKAGEAVGFLQWALEELEELKARDGGHGIPGLGRKKKRKERVGEEIASTAAFLNHYRKLNDAIHFEKPPPIASLRNMIPSGTAVVEIKPFTPPVPAFRSSTSSNPTNTTLTQDAGDWAERASIRAAGASMSDAAIDPLERRLNATHLEDANINDGEGQEKRDVIAAGIGALGIPAGATAPQAGSPAKDPATNPRAAYF